jgi:glycine cleavage system H lipoate-binding protein
MSEENAWRSDDGLLFTPEGKRWIVDVVRELPQRLGEPVSVELPEANQFIKAGDVLLAIELSKARVEFSAPHDLLVCESRHDLRSGSDTAVAPEAWHLVIEFQSPKIV